MRELTLTGDFCAVLKKIQELSDVAPSGEALRYQIENWNPNSIKATDEKRCIETLDAMHHVIKLKGSPVREGKNLVFSLIKTKLFESFVELNCTTETVSKEVLNKIEILISTKWGVYRKDNLELRHEISGDRLKYMFNLLNEEKIDSGIYTKQGAVKTAQHISRDVSEMNTDFRMKLDVPFDLIKRTKTSGYFLDVVHYSFSKDEFSTELLS